MANSYKILGQVNVNGGGQFQTLYTVPNGVSTICSSIIAANLGVGNAYFDVAVCPAGVIAPQDEHYIYKQIFLPVRDTFIATIGVTLSSGDTIKVASDVGKTVTFNLSGTEIT